MNEHTPREDFFNILRVLSSNHDFTQRDLSSHLGISLGKTNYLLRALAHRGFVKIKNFPKKDHKLKRVKYILTRKGFEQKLKLTYHFLQRKEAEYNRIKKEWEELHYLSEKNNKVGSVDKI